jgi:3',5'-cyclic AMP phosphodiesterase CpdA
MRDLRIGILTDVHLGRDAFFRGKLRKLGHRAQDLTEAFVQEMNHGLRPDLVMNLGDVVQDMTLEEDLAHYRAISQALAGLEAPLYPVVGNHDLIKMTPQQLQGFWREFSPQVELAAAPSLHYRFTHEGWTFLVLHSHEATDERVWMDQPQIDWLEAELARGQGPVVVFVHHSLADQDTSANWWFGRHPHLALIEQRREVRGLLEASGRVRAVINGHLHWNQRTDHGGVPYFTIQSPIENFDNAEPPEPAGSWAELTLSAQGPCSLVVKGRDSAAWTF